LWQICLSERIRVILKSFGFCSENDERRWRHAIKIEGGKEIEESIRKIVNAGIPVCGHLGLTPQSIYQFGTYKVRAKKKRKQKN
jgi:ketopantoate hydroxymethyltransferase